MSSNKLSFSSKTSSCRYSTSRTDSTKSAKAKVNPRRVLPSKKVPSNTSSDKKASSTGFLNENKRLAKPKKTTKSDFSVRKTEEPIDFCKNCGDVVCSSINPDKTSSSAKNGINTVNKTNTRNSNPKSTKTTKTNDRKLPKSIQQYYKNENYNISAESIEDITNGVKKISLDTIKEVSEIYPSDSIFRIYSETDEGITLLDTDDKVSLEQLKEFRQNNYFECHSAKSRIRNRGSATTLQDHTCVYRFYLNDRLFPVPLSSDHKNQVRCVECHLPMGLNVDESKNINGTIQAKVTIGKKNQDIMLLLPVKEPLIITEKRKEEKKDREVLFFGVINLDGFGNSIFNPTLPGNSFALKYQKGYKAYEDKNDYNYRDFDSNDIIVI